MTYLTVAVVLLTALGIFNLLLSYGLLRRLRAQAPAPSTPPPGFDSLAERLGAFRTTAADGSELTSADLEEGTFAVFMSPGCEPCTELLPRFTAAVDTAGLTARQVLAVVAQGPDPEPYMAALAPYATVVAGDGAADVVEAFGVRGFPVLCRVGADGTLTSLRHDPAALDRSLRTPAGVRA